MFSSACEMSELFEVGYLDVILLVLLAYFIYRFFFKKADEVDVPKPPPRLPPLDMKDMTIEELRVYDGVQNERVLLAVCGSVRYWVVYLIVSFRSTTSRAARTSTGPAERTRRWPVTTPPAPWPRSTPRP